MSDQFSQSFEDFEFVPSSTGIRKHAHPSQLQWMAHWTRASISPNLHTHEHYAFTSLIKDHIEGHCYLPPTNTKPSYACATNWENFTLYQVQNLRSSIPDPRHFPMFDINRKIETVMALKKRNRLKSAVESRMYKTQSAPKLLECVSEGEKVAETDQEMVHYQQFATRNLTYLKQEGWSSSDHPVMVSETKHDNPRYLGSSQTMLRGNCSSNFQEGQKEEAQTFSNEARHILISKELVGGSASAKVTGTALFERLTLPRTLHPNSTQWESSFIEKRNESLVKNDTHLTPFYPQVGSSSGSQKMPSHGSRLNLKGSKAPGTDSTGTHSKDVQSCVRKPLDPPTSSRESDSEKWMKRLRPSPSEATTAGAKRLKMGDEASPPQNGKMHNLLARVVNYNRSISEFPECRKHDESSFVPKNSDISVQVFPWIRRWCRNSQEKAANPPENSRVLAGNFEAKQLPSLAAMALMGKQVTNFQPCEFRRSGSTVVWK